MRGWTGGVTGLWARAARTHRYQVHAVRTYLPRKGSWYVDDTDDAAAAIDAPTVAAAAMWRWMQALSWCVGSRGSVEWRPDGVGLGMKWASLLGFVRPLRGSVEEKALAADPVA